MPFGKRSVKTLRTGVILMNRGSEKVHWMKFFAHLQHSPLHGHCIHAQVRRTSEMLRPHTQNRCRRTPNSTTSRFVKQTVSTHPWNSLAKTCTTYSVFEPPKASSGHPPCSNWSLQALDKRLRKGSNRECWPTSVTQLSINHNSMATPTTCCSGPGTCVGGLQLEGKSGSKGLVVQTRTSCVVPVASTCPTTPTSFRRERLAGTLITHTLEKC